MGIFDDVTQKDTVLVIDDENYVDLMKTTLERRGITAIHATTGKEGIELFKRHKPVSVLLDYHLPDVTSIEVCRELNNHEHNANIYFISGSPPDMIKQKMQGLDIKGFFSKPVNLLSVINVLVPPKFD